MATSQWGPDFVEDFLSGIFSRLERRLPEAVLDFKFFMHGDKPAWIWSSACSGTECPQWVMSALARRDPTMREILHKIGAEMRAAKRRFIRMRPLSVGARGPIQLFKNMFDITREAALNVADSEQDPPLEMPDAKSTDCWFIGFSRRTASGLASAGRRAMGDFIDDRTGSTGMTFSGVLLILQANSSPSFLLENVLGLLRDDQLGEVLAALRAIGPGYWVHFWRHCPVQHHGFPQSRWRIWIIGVRIDLCLAAGLETGACEEYCDQILDCIRQDWERMDIRSMLLPDDHEAIVQSLVEAHAKVARKNDSIYSSSSSGLQWTRHHATLARRPFSAPSSYTAWDSSDDQKYPHYVLLPLRDNSLLDLSGIRFPDSRSIIIDTSQADAQSATDCSPIITPKGRYWVCWKARELHGAEAMALQGLFITDEVIREFSSTLLLDLAGNAFHSTACGEATITLMCLRGFIERCRARRAPFSAPRARSLNELCGYSSSDSDLGEEFDVLKALRDTHTETHTHALARKTHTPQKAFHATYTILYYYTVLCSITSTCTHA